MSVPLPLDELKRVKTLQAYDILDTPPEVAFDHVTSLAGSQFQAPMALITFVDADRQWIKSCFGTTAQQTDRKLSFCAHAIMSSHVMVVPNTLSDLRFRDNPLVKGMPHIRSYAGAPLQAPNGQRLGSLCVMNTVSRRYNSQQKAMLAGLALIVMDQLNLRQMAREHRNNERERRADLAQSQIEILQRLARAAEFRDDDTGRHTQRVAHIAALLAKKLGFSPEQVQMIQQASLLHDVGKISVPDTILLKPSHLNEEEFATMQTHTSIGARILSEGKSDVIQMAERIAKSHHERWDGKGYPQGLIGESIPLEARILGVADVFDALTHERPYKEAWPVEKAVEAIQNGNGKQFDPKVVEAFLTLPHADLI